MKRLFIIGMLLAFTGCTVSNVRSPQYLYWTKSDRQQWVNAYNKRFPDRRYNQKHAMLRGANGTVLRINNGPLPRAKNMSTAEYLHIRGFRVLVYVQQSNTSQYEKYYKIGQKTMTRVYPKRKRGTHFGRHPAFKKEYQEQKDNPGRYTREAWRDLYR